MLHLSLLIDSEKLWTRNPMTIFLLVPYVKKKKKNKNAYFKKILHPKNNGISVIERFIWKPKIF